jgi:hypothetical protein
MNPDNTNNQINPVPVQPVVATNTSPVVPQTNSPEPVPQNPTYPTVSSTEPKKTGFSMGAISKKMKILLGLVVVLFVLMLLLSLTSAGQRVKNSILPSPVPSPEATPNLPGIGEPSAYANDPEIIDIENRISDFEKSMNTTTLKEDTIRPPQVDWDVTFKQ